MIKIEKIDKYFNRFRKNKLHVIDNTSLEFSDNGLVALLGPSGSGKTTLLNVVSGLDTVDKGKIYINGKRITRRTQNYVDKVRNLNIGYIFQDYKLIEDKSVYDNVAIVLKMLGIKDKNEIDKRVTYVLDKVGMLRYKRRPCNMLSGGERQRVGIARAIVKNPNIIIADEPTGNLDSKNSVEVMNIIKAISKDRLVLLVTHEVNLAKFYATRIIELEDGKITNDYLNTDVSDLDYKIINNLYLKDYKYDRNIEGINIYSNNNNIPKLNIVVENNNIYIKSLDNLDIEVVDDESSIQMINDNQKNISLEESLKYEFNFKDIINNNYKLKYSSIYNPISFIIEGFKKVFNFSVIKKFLLLGFFAAGIFIMYAISSILGSTTIKDSKFVQYNKNYLLVKQKKIQVDKYLDLENNLGANYIIPGDSLINLTLLTNDFYQFENSGLSLEGSLTDINELNSKKIIMGTMPTNNNEIVVDKMVLDKSLKNSISKNMGFIKYKDYLNREIVINNMPNKKIVGIVSCDSPSIYMNKDDFINVIYHTKDNSSDDVNILTDSINTNYTYDDYNLYNNIVSLREGRYPTNDYEVIVNFNNKSSMPLNKEIDKSINSHKLKVVGYYTSSDDINIMLINSNTNKFNLIENTSNISIYSNNKKDILNKAKNDYNLNIIDTYKNSRDKYINSQKDSVKTTLISSLIIIGISLIEMFLMIRSSFLSRVKEVGTLRAIGIKKSDIYIMFIGEILAISFISSIPGILFGAYILNILSKISYLEGLLVVTGKSIILAILFILIFNILIGLIPVFNTLRKRPAQILSRTDT